MSATRISLDWLKKHSKSRKRFSAAKVWIYSAEHNAWWRPNSRGYTSNKEIAGVYDLTDAYSATSHCGPEKKIFFELVDEGNRP